MTDTLTELEAALQRHIAEAYEGALVDGWVLVCSAQTVEKHDISSYRIVEPDSQPLHITIGLAEVLRKIAQDTWDSEWVDEDGD